MPAPADDAARRFGRFMEEQIPFNRLLGIRVETLEQGRCVLRIPWRDDLVGDPFRPSVHGGVTSALADTAGGMACFTLVDSYDDRVSTVDLRIDYLRPGAGADLRCEAKVERMGNRVAVARMEVYVGDLPCEGEERRPLATGQGVYNVLRRRD